MNTKEAIEILAKMKNYDSKRNVEALEIAISALEKQVPRKPIQEEDSALGYTWYCPNCGGWVDPSTYKHCPDCGQTIKIDKE